MIDRVLEPDDPRNAAPGWLCLTRMEHRRHPHGEGQGGRPRAEPLPPSGKTGAPTMNRSRPPFLTDWQKSPTFKRRRDG